MRQHIKDIISLASSKKMLSEKIKYLFKGFLFLPFMLDVFGKPDAKESTEAVASQSGDDIYPLF